MGISSTNRVIRTDNRATYRDYLQAVREYEIKKSVKAKRGRRYQLKVLHFNLGTCTQCGQKFDGHIASEQIKNKRENAPICIPCIMGRKRKPVIKQNIERLI